MKHALITLHTGRLGIQNHANVPLLGLQVSRNGAEVGCRFDQWSDEGVAYLVGTGRGEWHR